MSGAREETELREILGAIREVNASLDRRWARVGAACSMVWGVAIAGVFLFYHLLSLNPEPYRAALGGFTRWVWVGPVAVAYVATVAISSRIGRVTREPTSRRESVAAVLTGLVPSVVVAALVLSSQFERVPGAVVLWLALAGYLWMPHAAPPLVRAANLALKVAALVGGLALLLWPVPWAYLAAAAYYGLGLLGLGTVQYAASR